MFLRAAHYRHPAFAQGVKDMWPQAPGIAAWGLMTGVAMVKSGMSVFESVLMTLLVFAGSSQLAAIPLLVANAPAWVILATGFCVNLRFVVFSLHLRPYLMHLPRWERLMHGYLTADLTYVLFTRRYPKPGSTPEQQLAQAAYLAGNCVINWGSWMLASLIGVGLANFIPTQWGLGFAGILCLIGILCSLGSTRLRGVAAAVAGVAAVVAYSLPLKLNIVVAIAVAVLLCLGLERLQPHRPSAPGH
ncbi:AzlC family ABC transporter permease [Curvibacter sp. RS43]|uniref:AzlC family ABC transporter permease n=1 Tax=Curvibacter microcysteis TaxID=3026419 RepID=A0ABT5MIG1_9BURK|nr:MULTISPECIES: AzlC family ABC transporter permease [unclassified Curvibacter]MDD0810884.1 AzlC family ABC transporter permease [Curvibacter sp. RS43]MDD0816160.1 AzlC family ABC transporter permease [Curvibacter sp. HBC28]